MKKCILTSVGITVSAFMLSITPALAQFNDEFDKQHCNCNCFRGKPLGECKSYLVLESGFMSRAGESDFDRFDDFRVMFSANVGKMYNISKKSAIGGTINISPHNSGMDIGLGPRYRYWMSKGMALDISPRMILLRTGEYDLKGAGFQMDASVSIGELFSINTHYRNVKYEPNYYDVYDPAPGPAIYNPQSKGFYFGFSGRSYGAPVAPALVLLFHLLLKNNDDLVINF